MKEEKEKTMFDHYVEIQYDYDRYNFTKWCYNLFELNERLHLEITLTHKALLINDVYLMRSYFVTLWELIYNGKQYIERQKDNERHLMIIVQLLHNILNECSDDDYFMIQYYRNCASHIFLTRYSPVTDKGNAKKQYSETTFYKKDGNLKEKEFKLTYSQILEKVEYIFGGKLGTSLEPKYKKQLIERLYPIINKAYLQLQEMEDKDTNEALGVICPNLKTLLMNNEV